MSLLAMHEQNFSAGMTDSSILASVVIPCRNESRHIGQALDCILASTVKNLEILVVDGMSDDGTRAILLDYSSRFPQVKIIDNPKRITPVAFNLGIRHSSGKYIFIVGARHLLDPDYIETCTGILAGDQTIACVGGRVTNVYENSASELISRVLASPFAVGAGNFRALHSDAFVDTVGTPCYRRSIFDEIGYFDEELQRNQDDEFNFRVTRKGYRILFTVRTGIRYFVRASFGHLFGQYMQYGYWKVFVNRKHKAVTTMRQLVPAALILFIFPGVLFALLHRYLFFAWAGMLALYGLGLIVFALRTNGLRSFFATVYCFKLVHFAYGLGYLQGVWDFLVLRRESPLRHSKITR